MKTILENTTFVAIGALALLLLVANAFAAEPEPTAFDKLLEHYETVRQALTHDTVDGVSAEGGKIQGILEELTSSWSADTAGVEAEMAGEARALLPELSEAASALASAETLDAARDAFYDLSKPLVRWRQLATGDRPTVAYCSMAQRSWLQPEGALGNPYYGQSMLRCGEVVDG